MNLIQDHVERRFSKKYDMCVRKYVWYSELPRLPPDLLFRNNFEFGTRRIFLQTDRIRHFFCKESAVTLANFHNSCSKGPGYSGTPISLMFVCVRQVLIRHCGHNYNH